MKIVNALCGLAMAAASLHAGAQDVPPVDRININDPRIFDISDNGANYPLVDGPVATGELAMVQGPFGTLVGTMIINDIYNNTFGPINVRGRLSVSPSGPLKMYVAGSIPGKAQVTITGTYDGATKLMHVKVKMLAPGVSYSWNDKFMPSLADDVGVRLTKIGTLYNDNRVIVGRFELESPGHAIRQVVGSDRQLSTSPRFVFNRPGSAVFGTFRPDLNQFEVSIAQTSLGYGVVLTAGSLVNVTSDYAYPRNN